MLTALVVITTGVLVVAPASSQAAGTTCLSTEATVVGTEGDDVLEGTEGADVIAGLGGNDSIDGLGGDDLICGGDGSDELVGGDGDDSLLAQRNAFTADGYPLPEDLWGGPGDDYIVGGAEGQPADLDRVHYDDAPGPVVVDLSATTYPYQAMGEGQDDLLRIEVVYGSAYGDSLTGLGERPYRGWGAADPYVPDDALYGMGGDDTISGLLGRDELVGGAGADWIDGGEGRDGIHGGGDDDTLYGGLGDDFLDGDAGDDTIGGNEGYDSIDGGVGDDALIGGSERDTLSDPSGTDSADGGAASDDCSNDFEDVASCETIFDDDVAPPTAKTPRAVHVDRLRDPVKAPQLEVDELNPVTGLARRADEPVATCRGKVATIVGTKGGDDITGTDGRDVIVAGKGSDRIRSLGGSDLVCAQKGGDLLFGGKGDDQLYGGSDGYDPGAEDDVPDEFWGGPGDDVFDMGAGSSYPNPIHYDDAPNPIQVRGARVTGQGHDRVLAGNLIVGSAFDDTMVSFAEFRWFQGGPGDDTLAGGANIDRLDGGDGGDLVRGGPGADEIYGASGTDTLLGGDDDDVFWLSGGVNTVGGGWGDDAVVASAGSNTMGGGPGDDEFYGGSGVDTVDGGPHRSGDVCYQFLDGVTDCEFSRFSRYHLN